MIASPLILTAALIVVVAAITRLLTSWLHKVATIDSIPGPGKSFLLGNLPLEVLQHCIRPSSDAQRFYHGLMEAVLGYTHVYAKERIYRIWLAHEPWVVLWKPESVEAILSNNFLLQKSSQYDFLHPWLGTGLLTSAGSKWRSRRKLLIPAFHFKILHDFVPVFNEQASILVQRILDEQEDGAAADVVPLITACALDAICETIMGVKIGAQRNSNIEYCRAVNEVGECWLERLIQPSYWLDPLYYASAAGKRFSSKLSLLHQFTRSVIRDRKNQILGIQQETAVPAGGGDSRATHNSGEIGEKSCLTSTSGAGPVLHTANDDGGGGGGGDGGRDEGKRKAFLDLLLDHHLNGSDDLSEEGIREEVDTFMFEGHDTTSMALSWIVYLLGHHAEFQEKVWPEVDCLFEELEAEAAAVGTDARKVQIPLNRVKDLTYLDCIVKEGLRLCPSVPLIGRRVHEDLQVPVGSDKRYTIPAGTIVYVLIYMLHRDPESFPRPESFDPDRFLPTSGTTSSSSQERKNAFAYVPFSAGPRNCIGQRFALAEVKIVLAFLLRHFRFQSVEPRDRILVNMEMVLRPKMPLNVQIFRRDHQQQLVTHR